MDLLVIQLGCPYSCSIRPGVGRGKRNSVHRVKVSPLRHGFLQHIEKLLGVLREALLSLHLRTDRRRVNPRRIRATLYGFRLAGHREYEYRMWTEGKFQEK
jgi:hypothetical protein